MVETRGDGRVQSSTEFLILGDGRNLSNET